MNLNILKNLFVSSKSWCISIIKVEGYCYASFELKIAQVLVGRTLYDEVLQLNELMDEYVFPFFPPLRNVSFSLILEFEKIHL